MRLYHIADGSSSATRGQEKPAHVNPAEPPMKFRFVMEHPGDHTSVDGVASPESTNQAEENDKSAFIRGLSALGDSVGFAVAGSAAERNDKPTHTHSLRALTDSVAFTTGNPGTASKNNKSTMIHYLKALANNVDFAVRDPAPTDIPTFIRGLKALVDDVAFAATPLGSELELKELRRDFREIRAERRNLVAALENAVRLLKAALAEREALEEALDAQLSDKKSGMEGAHQKRPRLRIEIPKTEAGAGMGGHPVRAA